MAAKPWSSLSTQVLTSDIAEALGMKGQRGVRVAEVFKAQAAERAGVKIGDIILAVNGRNIDASQPGDQEVFDTMIRRLSIGGKAVLEDHVATASRWRSSWPSKPRPPRTRTSSG